MSQAPHQRRPHPQQMAAPFLEFDLASEIEDLQLEPEWHTGQNGKTLVKYDNVRVVLTAMRAHKRMPEHQTEGRVTLQTVVGRILVRAQGRTFDLPPGRLLVLDQGIPHDVEALEESAFLLTIAWPGRSQLGSASGRDPDQP